MQRKSWIDCGRLKPKTAKECREVETIEGMRRAINRYARDNPMVRTCEDLAWCKGWNGEDKMTYIAYHALLKAEKLEEMVLYNAAINANPRTLLEDDIPGAA